MSSLSGQKYMYSRFRVFFFFFFQLRISSTQIPDYPFARASSSVSDFNYRNKTLAAKLLRQGYRYHKLRKTHKVLSSSQWIGRKI